MSFRDFEATPPTPTSSFYSQSQQQLMAEFRLLARRAHNESKSLNFSQVSANFSLQPEVKGPYRLTSLNKSHDSPNASAQLQNTSSMTSASARGSQKEVTSQRARVHTNVRPLMLVPVARGRYRRVFSESFSEKHRPVFPVDPLLPYIIAPDAFDTEAEMTSSTPFPRFLSTPTSLPRSAGDVTRRRLFRSESLASVPSLASSDDVFESDVTDDDDVILVNADDAHYIDNFASGSNDFSARSGTAGQREKRGRKSRKKKKRKEEGEAEVERCEECARQEEEMKKRRKMVTWLLQEGGDDARVRTQNFTVSLQRVQIHFLNSLCSSTMYVMYGIIAAT